MASEQLLATIARNADPKVPLPIVLTMAERESTFTPTKRGAAGEYGLLQLLPATVRGADIGYQGPLANLLEPGLNTQLATRYLAVLRSRYGTWPEAIRAYNGSGPAARAYAAGVLQRLPAWDKYVLDNLEFFRKAIRSKGAGVVILVVAAAVAAVVILSSSSRRESEAAA